MPVPDPVPVPVPVRAPDLPAISGAPVPGSAMRAERPLAMVLGRRLRALFDRLIASGSQVPDDPVLDMRLFPWTQDLRAEWQAIRAEAIAVALRSRAAPGLYAIDGDKWRSFFLWGHGQRIDENGDRCPVTSALVERIPGLNGAFFSILAPGTHIPEHRGVTKGLITCHLGLIVPRDGDVRMRVHDRVVRWAEGETLVFDDTCRHEVWNETAGTRVVLVIQFERPLRQPAKLFAGLLLRAIRRSPFVQDARATSTSGMPR